MSKFKINNLNGHSNVIGDDNTVTNIITHNNQQYIQLNVLTEIYKSHLTDEQYEEIENILKQEKDSQKAERMIWEKLKSFGLDVAANIAAGMIAAQLFP